MVAIMRESTEFCSFVSVKIDSDILPLAKAAASLERLSVQDWLSDIANSAAAKRLGQNPVKRKAAKKDK